MKKFKNLILILLFAFILNNVSFAENNYFTDGKELFDKKQYNEAKFFFEKDIVFNPKNENSYLYLAKIFKIEKKEILEESNLKTTLLLNPKNEEAIFNLALLNIKKSNFSKSKELINTFDKVCKNLCSSKKKLQETLDNTNKK
ncbi:MAG: hypothetical protein ACJZ69_04750 [Pelagibacteraceae bacterium]|tara:strand:- start:176 stop:604 length:429 start_codon:yes stop_codon:yes gene_type:complete